MMEVPPPLVLVIAFIVSLAVFVPLTGVLVRFRANYNPKGLQLDSDGQAVPYTGPVLRSYFGMMVRVYRLEGVSGFYKGLMPTAISNLIVGVSVLLFINTRRPRHCQYRAPETGTLGTFIYSIGIAILSLPTTILTYRSIATPHRLPYLNLMTSLRHLLTPTERRRPWILYLTPGLMAAVLIHTGIIVLGLGPLRRVLLPELSEPGLNLSKLSPIKLAIYLVIFCLSVVIIVPLEVIATRLAIQRNHASAEYNSVSQEIDGDGEETIAYAGTDEDVIGLRSEGDPYLGLVDCGKRIINEEGWMTLYRAWWITFLGGLGSSIV